MSVNHIAVNKAASQNVLKKKKKNSTHFYLNLEIQYKPTLYFHLHAVNGKFTAEIKIQHFSP